MRQPGQLSQHTGSLCNVVCGKAYRFCRSVGARPRLRHCVPALVNDVMSLNSRQPTYRFSKFILRFVRRLLNRKSDLERLSDEAFVQYCYANLLHCEVDERVMQGYLLALSRGMDRLEVIEQIVNSLEFQAQLGTQDKQYPEFVPGGHFYSVIPSDEAVNAMRSFDWQPADIPAVNLREAAQWSLIHKLQVHNREHPYRTGARQMRYSPENGSFSLSDALILSSMMRHFRPQRVIEVGSGWSSAVMLDTNAHFLGNEVALTFIEPYPELLRKVMQRGDEEMVTLLEMPVQAVPDDLFLALCENDILFIDSSHVSKLGSDVNHLLFHVLPLLADGVIVHIHDIAYPFEYPLSWLEMGRFWNEAYLLRAFLQYNERFPILLFSTMMIHRHREWFAAEMPGWLQTGACIWLQKKSKNH